MKKMKNILTILIIAAAFKGYAFEIPYLPHAPVTHSQGGGKSALSSCVQPTATIDLDINNVRAKLMNGSDMWWDRGLGVARYEVPKRNLANDPGMRVSSLFAGAIWVGGFDPAGTLRVAAQTYRQNGNDFFAGPLDGNASVDATTCSKYDRFWKINLSEIQNFWTYVAANGATVGDQSAQFPNVFDWPSKGNVYAKDANGSLFGPGIVPDLAPYYDYNGNGSYDPDYGDYPAFDPTLPTTFPDQMIYWVYNDKGNVHTETQAPAIGLQVNATAFAFSTSDDVNNMTFYRYELYNKGNAILDSTYMTQWIDPDLGCYTNDYIGCDTSAGFGICYNSEANDAPCTTGYGSPGNYTFGDGVGIPMVGVDFFEGPTNAQGKQLGMTDFYYFINDNSVLGNPVGANDYYGYMTGTWRDRTQFTAGGNAHLGSKRTHYVFPDAPNLSGINPVSGDAYWSMCNPKQTAADMRMVLSSGPFQLIPGSKQRITVGVVWVPAITYPCPSFNKILAADRKAQALFDAHFKLLNGPDAPDVSIKEYDKELILQLTNNSVTSNNFHEHYVEFDNEIMPYVALNPKSPTRADSLKASFQFEGYQIFQLRDNSVSVSDLHDVSLARQIAQVDIKNGITKIVNFTHDAVTNADVPILEVDGQDNGIKHTFDVKTDAFATGSNTNLVNHQTYYYMVIAYSYNNYKQFSSNDPTSQSAPYKSSRRGVKVYSGIPHIVAPEQGGTVLHSKFGDQPQITRVEGFGSGTNLLNITQTSVDQILQNGHLDQLVYDSMGGPIAISVFDPKMVKPSDYEVYLIDSVYSAANNNNDSINKNAYWKIVNKTTGETRYSLNDISVSSEQVFEDWGFSVNIAQNAFPGTKTISNGPTNIVEYAPNNGFLGWDYKVNSQINFWYNYTTPGTADGEGDVPNNWIRSGTYLPSLATHAIYGDYTYHAATQTTPAYCDPLDKNEDFEKIAGRTWAPYRLCQYDIFTTPTDSEALYEQAIIPGYSANSVNTHKLADVFSVDIVFTSDKSKWTRSAVVETNPRMKYSNTSATLNKRLRGRSHASWIDKYAVNPDGSPQYDQSGSTGLSWFPGYAINVETGQRLNIIFGEDSHLPTNNGDDMLWNPTDSIFNTVFSRLVYGGRHYIYVLNSEYQEDLGYQQSYVADVLANNSSTGLSPIDIFNSAIWVGVPMTQIPMKSAKDGIIPADFTLKLRVAKPYCKANYGNNSDYPTYPKYTFSMKGLAAETNVIDTAKSALDLINVVPNPYYAFSNYETGMLDTKVKITNLPRKCTITIYAVDGTLIRQFNRDTELPTYQEWDLKNTANVPISSGLYLIHISATGLGKNQNESAQKVIKWFGVMRQVDLNTF